MLVDESSSYLTHLKLNNVSGNIIDKIVGNIITDKVLNIDDQDYLSWSLHSDRLVTAKPLSNNMKALLGLVNGHGNNDLNEDFERLDNLFQDLFPWDEIEIPASSYSPDGINTCFFNDRAYTYDSIMVFDNTEFGRKDRESMETGSPILFLNWGIPFEFKFNKKSLAEKERKVTLTSSSILIMGGDFLSEYAYKVENGFYLELSCHKNGDRRHNMKWPGIHGSPLSPSLYENHRMFRLGLPTIKHIWLSKIPFLKFFSLYVKTMYNLFIVKRIPNEIKWEIYKYLDFLKDDELFDDPELDILGDYHFLEMYFLTYIFEYTP